MTLTLRILLILSSVLASCTVVRRIRKSKMQIDDAVFWVLFSLVLIVLAVFPHLLDFYSYRDTVTRQSIVSTHHLCADYEDFFNEHQVVDIGE